MSRALPTGTVTLLFTDIEGSTRLLRELGTDGYAEALAHHRRELRDAFAAAGGVEVDTQGDAFFVSFPTATGAVAAANAAQEALAPGPIAVRMGLHTGTPSVAAEGYVGIDVHRGARVAGLAHGGQVLLSAATAALVEDQPLRDLGRHRLKDFDAPAQLFQLGTRDFPALRTPGATFGALEAWRLCRLSCRRTPVALAPSPSRARCAFGRAVLRSVPSGNAAARAAWAFFMYTGLLAPTITRAGILTSER